jgi:phosphatidylserine/phosphatidylglycerophosphate/cardiolipin synthase-like enzyme
MSRDLIVLPDDSAGPILDAIAGAMHTIRLKMFVFSDRALLRAILKVGQRGVNVRVMLNHARRDGQEDNSATRQILEKAGIEVKDANPAFALTHEKSMVVDDAKAFVKSLNWATRNLTVTRDYAVVTTCRREVVEIIQCFEADWRRQPFDPGRNARLIWCPGAGRERICEFIDKAERQLFLQNERFQDAVIIDRLIRAARRGVKVHVMARAPHTLSRDKLVEGVGGLRILNDVGIKIRKLKHLKLHGKILLADGAAAIVGSINFAPGSFETRRELAIEVRDAKILNRLQAVTRHDWKHSRPLDLSDVGLLADLENIEGSGEMLGIGIGRDRTLHARAV